MKDENGIEHCASCGFDNVVMVRVTDKFVYGVGPDAVTLSAEVDMFSCKECGEQYTGEQGEKAREAAVGRLHQAMPQMMHALIAQHEAIDRLFAMLIELSSSGCVPTEVFYPSKSGQPWKALKMGKAALAAAGIGDWLEDETPLGSDAP